ncbi:MAG TPA: hypothetical protein PLP29_15290 [Candidatus Ozemobacteraceae bacterium]|nr:hypothetical protein [Candidatus Ozemobacteraceae bacterium]
MRYGIIPLASSIHDPERVKATIRQLVGVLGASLDIREVIPSDRANVDVLLVAILTGGTEHAFRNLYRSLADGSQSVTLVTLPHSNSLPAGLEILAWLESQGVTSARLLHGTPEEIADAVQRRGAALMLRSQLDATRIGVVGTPSDWLIASHVDRQLARQRFGVDMREIPIEEVHDAWHSLSETDVEVARAGFETPAGIVEPSENDRDSAARLYAAMRRLVDRHGLSAVTLRCFDLLKTPGTTGCLALSRLNDEGVTAGCEGDVPALLTMHIHRLLSGHASFMANPSQFAGDEIVFAHCTVACSMVTDIRWRSHFESGIGIGVAGTFSPGMMTVARLGGPDAGRLFIAEGEVRPHEHREDLCRTQVRLRLPGVAELLSRNPLGNHHILARGAWKQTWLESLAPFDITIVS